MDQKYLDKKYLDEIVGINKLWMALGELMYMRANMETAYSKFRDDEAKRKFGEALIELRIIK